MLTKTNLLGVGITTSTKADIFDAIKTYLKSSKNNKPLTIVTPNPEQLVLADTNGEFRTQLNAADIALPDGSGVVWALKRNDSKPNQHLVRIAGTDFMLELVRFAADENLPVGFVGGSDKVAQQSLDQLKISFPELRGWSDPGIVQVATVITQGQNAVNDYIKNLTKLIKANQTRMVFLAFGAPVQEYIMSELAKQTEGPLVMMVVGGAFDYLSGEKKRAPQLVRQIGFEWLWRLVREPSRWKRQLALPKFVLLVLRSKSVLK